MAWRFTSPLLNEMETRAREAGVAEPGLCVLRECPTGAVIREAPYVYQAINAYGSVDSGAIDPLHVPTYLSQAFNVIGSEKARLRELAEQDRQTKRDASYGSRVLKGRGRG